MNNQVKKEQTVAVYGSNLVMSTIVKSLQKRTQFQVHQLDRPLSDISQTTDAIRPDVIVFDLATAPNDLIFSLLREHPLLTMIGVDIENRRMLVLSGEHFQLMTADDLVKAIEEGDLRACN